MSSPHATLADDPGDVPRCPRCNANDVSNVGPATTLFKRKYQKRRCNACGRQWRRLESRIGGDETKWAYPSVPICPECRSVAEVTSTRVGIRWIKCGGCGKSSKQVGKVVKIPMT